MDEGQIDKTQQCLKRVIAVDGTACLSVRHKSRRHDNVNDRAVITIR